jgi:hypothetical protein
MIEVQEVAEPVIQNPDEAIVISPACHSRKAKPCRESRVGWQVVTYSV